MFKITQEEFEVVTARITVLEDAVEGLLKTVTELTAKKDVSTREMTDDDAKRIMIGDLKDKSHKDAAKVLGLSYGQIYSCRLGYTFKSVHKAMKESGTKNQWIKE